MSLTDPTGQLAMWLTRQRTWLKKNADTPHTHISMDGFRGGIISIKPSLEQTFLAMYGASLQNHSTMYILEARTEVFRFFLDVDLKVRLPKIEFTDEERRAFCQVVYETVRLFYPLSAPAAQFTMMVCDTSAWEVAKQKEVRVDVRANVESMNSLLLKFQEELNPAQAKKPKNKKEKPKIPKDAEVAEAVQEKEKKAEAGEGKKTEDEKYSKAGNMHIHFPGLYVNQRQAAIMARGIAAKLTSIIGPLEYLMNDWFDVIDLCVYMKNGLRMLGSHKSAKCPECRGRKCKACNQIGKIDLGRVYQLRHVFQKDTWNEPFLKKLLASPASVLQFCSIRAVDQKTPTGNWNKYEGCPSVDGKILDKSNVSRPRLFNGIMSLEAKKLSIMSQDDRSGQSSRHKINIGRDSHLFKLCQRRIRKFHTHYRDVDLHTVSTTIANRYFRVTVQGDGSNYCMNLDAEKKSHVGNTVYFLIKPSGITQRCWCRCEKLSHRLTGLCRDFTSASKPLLNSDVQILFPKTQQHGLDFQRHVTLSNVVASGSKKRKSMLSPILARLYYKAFVGAPSKKKKRCTLVGPSSKKKKRCTRNK